MRPILAIALVATACGSESSASLKAADYYTGGAETASGTTWTPPADAETTLPPEQEDDFLALPPAQTDVFVFVANPGRNTVTRINVNTQAVRTVDVGVGPEVVVTTPDYDTTVVFNKGDDTVSIIDADQLTVESVPVRANFNDMRMAPGGTWVALFHNAAKPDDEALSGGLQSFNETSFVNVLTGQHWPMAVGFNPRVIKFTPDDRLAAVVSDSYLAVVDLTEEPLSPRLIELAPDLVEAPVAEEVALSPDGEFAFIRQFGTDHVLVVDLLAGVVDEIPVGLNPTDLDLSPDGLQAVVVSRGDAELWVLDATNPYATPDVKELPAGPAYGSLLFDPTGVQAVVYTTAGLVDRYVSWNLLDDDIRERSLVKPVSSMAITPTGESLIAFHTFEDALDADVNSPFYGEDALTMISLDDFRTNPLRLPGTPSGYANSSNGNYGFFVMEDQPYLEVLNYRTLLHDEYPIKSPPVYVGVLPDLDLDDGDEPAAWVSQEHDLGRISFFDADDVSLETITGFELNSQIEVEE